MLLKMQQWTEPYAYCNADGVTMFARGSLFPSQAWGALQEIHKTVWSRTYSSVSTVQYSTVQYSTVQYSTR